MDGNMRNTTTSLIHQHSSTIMQPHPPRIPELILCVTQYLEEVVYIPLQARLPYLLLDSSSSHLAPYKFTLDGPRSIHDTRSRHGHLICVLHVGFEDTWQYAQQDRHPIFAGSTQLELLFVCGCNRLLHNETGLSNSCDGQTEGVGYGHRVLYEGSNRGQAYAVSHGVGH